MCKSLTLASYLPGGGGAVMGVLRVTVHQDECEEMGDVTDWRRCECTSACQ